jgi:hypothetical protein
MAKNKLKKLKKINFVPSSKAVFIGIFCVIFLLFLTYLAQGLIASSMFTLKEVRSNIALNSDVRAGTPGQSLFDVNLGKLYSRICQEHPEYKDVHVIREFPSVLKVEIVARKPFAYLKGEKLYLIDREGVVIDEAMQAASLSAGALIPIEIDDYNHRLRKGERINDSRLEGAFHLIEELKKTSFAKKFPVELINATVPGAMCLVIGTTRIILGRNDFKHKLYILDTILRGELNGNLYMVEYIDLRYEKVYLGRKR